MVWMQISWFSRLMIFLENNFTPISPKNKQEQHKKGLAAKASLSFLNFLFLNFVSAIKSYATKLKLCKSLKCIL